MLHVIFSYPIESLLQVYQSNENDVNDSWHGETTH